MNFSWKSLVFLVCGFFFSACGRGITADSLNSTGAEQGLPGSELNFASVSEKVLQPMCVNCHSNQNGNSGGVNLETYANVISHVLDIRTDVMDGSMPESGPALNSEEKNLILAWLNVGAPEFSQTAPATPTTPTTPTTTVPAAAPTTTLPSPTTTLPPVTSITFSQVSSQVLLPKCISCHSSFSNYSTVYSRRSSIKSEIQSGSMPKGSSLTSAQKSTILNWIAAGAPQ